MTESLTDTFPGVTVNAVRLHIRTLKERAGATDPLPKATPKSSAEGTRKRASPTKPRATKSNRVTKEKTGKSKAVKTEKAEPTPTPTPQADGNESQEETDLPGFEGTATMGIKTEVEQALEDAELHEC